MASSHNFYSFEVGGGEGHFFTEELDESIQSGSFIGVYPEGIQGSWNLGREASTADDVAFVRVVNTPSRGVGDTSLAR